MLKHDNRIMAIIGTVLSGVDGVEIYKKIHRIYNVAILLLTRNNNEEIGRLLRFKADRFELKLFGYPLLEAHVEAILR
jgi:DNA-binding response OmpR family regulator